MAKKPLYPSTKGKGTVKFPSVSKGIPQTERMPQRMETDIRRLGVEDLLNICNDRFSNGIAGEKDIWELSAEKRADYEHTETCLRRLEKIAEKYGIDARKIR